jgi:hypothetical protein
MLQRLSCVSSLDAFISAAPLWAAFNTGFWPQKSAMSAPLLTASLWRRLFGGRSPALWLDLRSGAAPKPPALATRIDQYSHERVRPVVLELICPASIVSPGESVAMSVPMVIART